MENSFNSKLFLKIQAEQLFFLYVMYFYQRNSLELNIYHVQPISSFVIKVQLVRKAN